MKKLLMIIVLLTGAIASHAQSKYFTKNGKISFDATSSGSPEQIVAVNEKATSVLDLSNGTMEFAVLMKAFNFEKALMQEHFNENYVESDQFPKAIFKGTVLNIAALDLAKEGEVKVNVKGMLTLHGVTKEVTAEGSLMIKDNAVSSGKSKFTILLSDYKIEIPSLVKDKVGKEANIIVEINYQPLKTS